MVPLAHRTALQRLHHRRAPGPAGPRQGLGRGQGLVPGREGPLRHLLQQHSAALPERRGLGRRAAGLGQAQSHRQPRRRGRAEPRRPHEGVELQRVEDVLGPGRRLQPQPPGGQARVGHHHRRAQGQGFRLGRGQLAHARSVRRRGLAARQHHQRRRQLQGGREGVHPRLDRPLRSETEQEQRARPVFARPSAWPSPPRRSCGCAIAPRPLRARRPNRRLR